MEAAVKSKKLISIVLSSILLFGCIKVDTPKEDTPSDPPNIAPITTFPETNKGCGEGCSSDCNLYVIGGNAESSVLMSHDGVSWETIGNVPTKERGSSVVFNKKIFYIGGRNNVYSSSDGVTWVKQNGSPLPLRVWKVLVYNNRIWAIGGDDGTGTPVSSAYSSPDGSHWDVEANLPSIINRFAAVVFQNKIFTYGAYNVYAPVLKTIFSYDSKNLYWNIPGYLPTPYVDGSATTFNDKVYLIGGNGNVDPSFKADEVMSSSDGVSFQLESRIPNRTRHPIVTTFDGKLWVMGGRSMTSEEIFTQVYSSTDGKTWDFENTLPIGKVESGVVKYSQSCGSGE